MAQTWQPLQENDTVRIIAPGSKVDAAWEQLQKACEFLAALKLNPVYSKNIFSTKKDVHVDFYHFANTDEKRYEDFVDAMKSDAKAVWCFRGGYGSDRVLSHVVKNNFIPKCDPKLFVGFSDITNLHNYMNTTWHWSTLHAASIRQLGLEEIETADVQVTKDIIFGNQPEIKLNLIPLNASAKQAADLTSEISGGNLTVIQSAIATAWQMPVKNKILLFEDVDEAPYRISRMLQHFLASNQLEGAKAILFGDFIPNKPTDPDKTIDPAPMDFALQEFADQCAIPVLRYKGIGHGKRNYPIPFATPARLVLGEEPVLVVASGATL